MGINGRALITENQLQRSCIDLLRLRARPDVLWHHSPNECVRENNVIHQIKMGMKPGFFDLLLLKGPMAHLVEIKVGNGTLNQEQQNVRGWCFKNAVPHKVVRDLEAFQQICITWGLFK